MSVHSRLSLLLVLSFAVASPAPAGADEGQTLYQQRCAACHSIGGGRLVGPDLAGVTDKRTSAWLIQFVRASQAMVRAGDPIATALFDEFKIPMPDHEFSDAQIASILAYIAAQSSGAVTTGAAASDAASMEPAQPSKASPEQIAHGLELFQGTTRLQNGGPACNSCHDVVNDAVIGGGILARELTDVFSRMGAPGVSAILGSPPFPVMQTAYDGRPLVEDEIIALVAFLQDTDERHLYQQPRDYGIRLLYTGAAGVVLLYGFFGLVWSGRKRKSTNQDIYDRQIKSQ